jgi:hypothetical protein
MSGCPTAALSAATTFSIGLEDVTLNLSISSLLIVMLSSPQRATPRATAFINDRHHDYIHDIGPV